MCANRSFCEAKDVDLQIVGANVLYTRRSYFCVIYHRATSATSHVVLGQFKTCVILLGGFLLFRSNPGTLSICGAITALAGMSLYTYLSMLVSEQKTTNAALRQSLSFSLSRSKLCKDASDLQNGGATGESV